MPDDSLPPVDKAVLAFFEIVAFALGWGGVDRLLAGTSLFIVVPIFAATILTSYAGFKWPQIKQKLRVNPAEWFLHVYRVWPHSYIGGTIVIVLCAALGLVLWVHGAKKTVSPAATVHQAEVTMPPGGWTTEWGSKPPSIAYVITNVAPIVPFGSHFRLMLVCHVVNNTVDEMGDTRIEKSALFSITQAQMVLEMSMSQDMMKRALPNNMVHIALVLLPAGVSADQIKTLSDVTPLRGYILATNGFVPSVKQQVIRGPDPHAVTHLKLARGDWS